MRRAAMVLLLLPAVIACGPGGEGRLVVSAAASLAQPFAEMERAFERLHPDIDVVLNVAGSTAIRDQIVEGAPADVVAVANPAVMDVLVASGLVGEPQTFATNHLVLAVPPDNPGSIGAVTDLTDERLLVGMCAPEVPCGHLAVEFLDRLGVDVEPDTLEPDVLALVRKVEDGDLDAGFVYASDAVDRDLVVIDASGPETIYPIAVVATTTQRQAADEFVAFVVSDAGWSILAEHGFGR